MRIRHVFHCSMSLAEIWALMWVVQPLCGTQCYFVYMFILMSASLETDIGNILLTMLLDLEFSEWRGLGEVVIRLHRYMTALGYTSLFHFRTLGRKWTFLCLWFLLREETNRLSYEYFMWIWDIMKRNLWLKTLYTAYQRCLCYKCLAEHYKGTPLIFL